MKRLLDIIINSLLIPDPYIQAQFGGAANAQQGIRVKYAEAPVFPEGVTKVRNVIVLSTDADMPHQNLPNLEVARFFIDFYSDRGFQWIEDLYYNIDPATITTYGFPRGVRALLADQRYSLASDLFVLKFLQLNGPRYNVNDDTKTFFATTQWEAHVITTAALQFS
jgi:hypothetical protein